MPLVAIRENCPDFSRAVSVLPGVFARVIDSGALSIKRLGSVNVAFLARHVPVVRMQRLLTGILRPRSGDLVLVRVGPTDGICPDLMVGRGDLRRLREGMEAILVYGRGWGDIHSLAALPRSLEKTQLIARCGLASTIMSDQASGNFPWVHPLGLVADAAGQPLNVTDFSPSGTQDN